MSTNAYWITRKRMLCYPTKMKTHRGQTIFYIAFVFLYGKTATFLLEISYTINTSENESLKYFVWFVFVLAVAVLD